MQQLSEVSLCQTEEGWITRHEKYRQTRGGEKKWTETLWVHNKLEDKVLVVCLNLSRWQSPSVSGCRLKDNRPTESSWQNMTITLILPFVCVSMCPCDSVWETNWHYVHSAAKSDLFFPDMIFSPHCPQWKWLNFWIRVLQLNRKLN